MDVPFYYQLNKNQHTHALLSLDICYMLSPILFVVHVIQPVFRRGNAGSKRFRNEEIDHCPVVRRHSLDCKMQVNNKKHP